MNEYEAEIIRLRGLLTEERRVSREDVLTGLGNRRSFDEALGELIQARAPFALLYFDVANLHSANAVLGHEGADEWLKTIANAIRSETDAAHRVGGDEFAVLLPGVERIAHAEVVRDRIEAAIGDREVAAGVSMFLVGGIAIYRPGMSLSDLSQTADREMQKRKHARKVSRGEATTREAAEARIRAL